MNDYIAERMRTNGTNRTVEPNIYATKTGQLRIQLRGKWLPGLAETLGGARIKLAEAKLENSRVAMLNESAIFRAAIEKIDAEYRKKKAAAELELKEVSSQLAAAHKLNGTAFKDIRNL